MKTIIAVILISIVTANAQTVNVNSLYEGPYDIQRFVAWKKYLEERKKTRKDTPLSPLDNQAVQPAVTPRLPRPDMMHFFALRASTPTRSAPPQS